MRRETGIRPKSWETELAATSEAAGTQAGPTSMPKTRAEGTEQTAWLLTGFYFFYFTASFEAVLTMLPPQAKGSCKGSSHPGLDGRTMQPVGWASMSCRLDRVGQGLGIIGKHRVILGRESPDSRVAKFEQDISQIGCTSWETPPKPRFCTYILRLCFH